MDSDGQEAHASKDEEEGRFLFISTKIFWFNFKLKIREEGTSRKTGPWSRKKLSKDQTGSINIKLWGW